MSLPSDDREVFGTPIALAAEMTLTILEIVKEGWAFAQLESDVTAESNEVLLNERLRDGMRRAVNHAGILLIVAPGTESRSQPQIVVPDGRTDIPIYSFAILIRAGDHDPHAIIECKRVAGGNTTLCREYVVNGIDRFRRGQYSARHTTGFMVGFVLTGCAAKAAEGINAYLTDRKGLADCLVPSKLLDAPWMWASRHCRDGLGPIALHHAFLDFASSK